MTPPSFDVQTMSSSTSTVESVVLLQDRPSQLPSSYLAIANPNDCASVRFPPTSFCDFHKDVPGC